MKELLSVLKSIDSSLKLIVQSLHNGDKVNPHPSLNSLEQTKQSLTKLSVLISTKEDWVRAMNSYSDNINSTLFKMLANVYLDEEIKRVRSGKNKKAARRVSVNLGNTLVHFFAEHLHIPEVKVERIKEGGLVVFSINNEVFACMKFMTDLGYNRSDAFYDSINNIISTSKKLFNLESDRIYIVVASLRNGVSRSFVEKLLEHPVDSKLDFLHDRELVRTFMKNYRKGMKQFSNNQRNVLFLASDLHPNEIANALLEKEIPTSEILYEIEQYDWLSSIGELIQTLEKSALSFR